MPQVFRTEIEDNSEAILKTLQQKSTKITASPIKSICEKKENLCTIDGHLLFCASLTPVKCWADVFKKPGFSVQNGAESESETEDDEDNLFDIPVFAMPSQVAPPLEPDTPLSEFIPQDSDESPKILPLESGSPEKEKVPLKSKRSLKVDEDFVMPDVDDDDEDWVEEDTSAVDEKVSKLGENYYVNLINEVTLQKPFKVCYTSAIAVTRTANKLSHTMIYCCPSSRRTTQSPLWIATFSLSWALMNSVGTTPPFNGRKTYPISPIRLVRYIMACRIVNPGGVSLVKERSRGKIGGSVSIGASTSWRRLFGGNAAFGEIKDSKSPRILET